MGQGLHMEEVYGEYDDKLNLLKDEIASVKEAIVRIGREKRACQAPTATWLYVIVIVTILSDMFMVFATIYR
jgi:hypothetical protein